MFPRILAPLAATSLVLVLASCAATSDAGPSVPVAEDTIILDVRTPEEHAGGHLEGAVLLDLSSGDFAAAIPTFDPEADYLVYCRSGNRAGQAIALMDEAGIENTTNLGSLEQAAEATGLPIVGR